MNTKYRKWLLLLGVVVILVFFLNTILSSLISKVVHNQLDDINSKGNIALSVEKVQINIFSKSLRLKGVEIRPDSLYFEDFKQGKTDKTIASHFYLSELKIKGFSLFKILISKEISIESILASRIDLTLYKSYTDLKKPDNSELAAKNSFDSIYIKGIEQINLSRIEFDDFNLHILHAQKEDTLFSYKGKEMDISGIALEDYKEAKSFFRFNNDSLKIHFYNQNFDVEKGNYRIFFEDIVYDFPKKSINILNFTLKPSMDKAALASTYPYNSEVYDVEVKNMGINGFYLDSVVRHGLVALDSIVVDGLNLSIYKDLTKPFNLKKRPKFLNQKLKAIEHPLHIDLVKVRNAFFSYREKHESSKDLMAIDIADMNADINYITTVKDSLQSGKNLSILVAGKLNKVADMKVNIYMDYNTWNDSYSFTGSLGSAKFKAFESALFPAAGIKFKGGVLNSMQFTVHGTPVEGTHGRMSMLYSNINANLIKGNKEKKAISWMAHSVSVSSNPSKNGKLRIGLIEAERVPYKGFGNLLWKSVLSGMINTINPLGKTVNNPKKVKKNNNNKKKKKKKK